jgi:hypothetical protein
MDYDSLNEPNIIIQTMQYLSLLLELHSPYMPEEIWVWILDGCLDKIVTDVERVLDDFKNLKKGAFKAISNMG